MTSGLGPDLLILGLLCVFLYLLRHAVRLEREQQRSHFPKLEDVSELDVRDWPHP